jgi:hypothetical protein
MQFTGEMTRRQGGALVGCMQQHHALEENECLIVDEGFPSEDPETTASELRGLMRFAGETTRRPRASIRGMQQHHAPGRK